MKHSRRSRLTVAGYGGGTRRVEAVSGTGHWYQGGDGLAPIRWVFVHDCNGTHRDEYFFTTDLAMTPKMYGLAIFGDRKMLKTGRF